MDAEQLREATYALLPDWRESGSQPTNWTFLEGGYSNLNYAFEMMGNRYVLRVSRSSTDREHEQRWYRRLPADVGVRPVAYDSNTGNMILPWVEGELLIDYWTRLCADKAADVVLRNHQAQLLAYLKSLHQRLPPVQRTYDALTDTLQTAASERIDSATETCALPASAAQWITCHNDLNPWNIIIDPTGRWITLDWEWVGLNDPLFDVVGLHQGLLLNEGCYELCYAYLDADDEHVRSRVRAALGMFWQRELDFADAQIARGNRRTEILQQQRTAGARLADLDAIT